MNNNKRWGWSVILIKEFFLFIILLFYSLPHPTLCSFLYIISLSYDIHPTISFLSLSQPQAGSIFFFFRFMYKILRFLMKRQKTEHGPKDACVLLTEEWERKHFFYPPQINSFLLISWRDEERTMSVSRPRNQKETEIYWWK